MYNRFKRVFLWVLKERYYVEGWLFLVKQAKQATITIKYFKAIIIIPKFWEETI